MFKALLRVQLSGLRSFFAGMSRSKKKQTPAKTVGYALLMLYVLGAFGFMFYNYFGALAAPFRAVGAPWLYFALFAIVDFALMFVGSIFTAKAQLFEAKDNELLLSMPIPPRMIVASRMVMLLVLNAVFELPVAVPALLVWCRSGAAAPAGVAGFVLVCLLLPFFSVSLSALMAWLISLLTARVRNKSLMTSVFSLAFLGLYFYAISRVNTALAAIAASGEFLAERLGAVRPLYWLGEAMAEGDALSLLLSALCLLLPFALAYLILAATFIRTATARRGFSRIRYRDRGQKVSSVSAALLGRELRHFFASSPYLLNAGLGAVMTLAAAAAALIWRGRIEGIQAMLGGAAGLAAPAGILALCLLAAMTDITAPSVSIEGKTLWILQSLPVETGALLRAKLKLHLWIALPPVLLASLAAIFVLRPGAVLAAELLLVPAAYTLFVALLGLFCNLRHPNLDWLSETQAVKSGVSVLLTMLFSWGALVPPALLAVFLPGGLGILKLVAAGYLLAVLALSWFLYRWLMRRGCEIFASL